MIWLIGNNGMLGQEVERVLREGGRELVASDREVDITSTRAVEEFFAEHAPDWLINCAAYTAVDRAEDEPKAAERLNALGPENLARACATHGAALVHVSTDYVFDGERHGPYPEDAQPNPIGVYGKTKAEGERRIAAVLDHRIICRTAWLFGPGGGNFVSTMIRLFAERDELAVVSDQHGRPTYAPDLARTLVALLDNAEIGAAQPAGEPGSAGAACPWGAYHFSNSGETTWYEFATEIYRRATLRGLVSSTCSIRPVTSAEYPTKAHRPANSVLSTARTEAVLGAPPRPWQEALADYLDAVESEHRISKP
ncbi:MAG: dTDP-4-dehydrorhamnose reductase [Spirochaetaceae bacterium]